MNRNFNSSGNERPAPITPAVRSQSEPVRVAPQEIVRPARNYNDAVISAPPPQRAAPLVEQRQVIEPSPVREQQRVEQRIEQRQNAVEAVPHNVAPAPAPAPAQNQPRSSGQNSGSPDKNNKNQ